MALPAPMRRLSVLDAEAKLLTVGESAAYNIALVAVICFVAIQCIQDVVYTGRVNLHTDLLLESFAEMHWALGVWLAMVTSTFIMPIALRQWASFRLCFTKQGAGSLVWDFAGLSALAAYFSALLVLPATTAIAWSLPPGATLTLIVEQLRLLMKVYAYARTQVAAVLREGAENSAEPNFNVSHFAYFMFAPTLVYKDHYPRTSTTRPVVVLRHALEVVACVVVGCEVFGRCVVPLSLEFLQRLQQVPGFLPQLVQWIFLVTRVLPASTLLFLMVYYITLHAVQNAFAEILRFQDRTFFMDWWNGSSLRTFYRTWNSVVQMWLYTYMYKDLKKLGASSWVAKFVVFSVSAIFHEYVFVIAEGFCVPVLYVMFGLCGFILSYEPTPTKTSYAWTIGNLFLLSRQVYGWAMLFSFYTVEYQARILCRRQIASSLDYFVPRSWFCESLVKTEGENLTLF